jgi:hypothetical protein
MPDEIQKIVELDLQNLVTNQVAESRTLEYKQTLPGGSDDDKKEFLADVSSFANTVGGDLFYGIKATNGIASEVVGIALSNTDAEILKLESILTSGLQPRISHQIHPITLATGNVVFVIRVRPSFLAPHRVIFKSVDRFYGRGSAGKYSLDTEQLRSAFLQSETVTNKIRDFHTNRILEIEADRTPFPLMSANRIIIHLIPLEAFSSNINVTQEQMKIASANTNAIRPMMAHGWNLPVPNIDGWACDAGTPQGKTRSYLQIFRKGVVEAVESSLLERDGSLMIPTYTFEAEIIDHVKQCLGLLKSFGIVTPIYIFVTLTNVAGLKLGYDTSRRFRDESTPIKQNILNLPECVMQDYNDDVAKILHPSLNIVWNACGMEKSLNYDNDGNFIVQ